MRVFVVEYGTSYDNYEVVGVFRDRDHAIAFAHEKVGANAKECANVPPPFFLRVENGNGGAAVSSEWEVL